MSHTAGVNLPLFEYCVAHFPQHFQVAAFIGAKIIREMPA
jgi:hypothetical protein